ncbi:MAG: hypothetical protein M9963_03255 [Kiritimatiellae bacterium]|nr:hypothetical protein [Kiritimatiellia bacterium]MCO5061010.1 hypothetical protein [Kiritimatiellia bacterium]MCO6400021.1 hypothetical protein [Verrucomicrobiota bacterium]
MPEVDRGTEPDGTLRNILHICVRPDAASLRAYDAAALDYFATLFMRLDPDKIAIVCHAADNRIYPLALENLEAARFTARSPEPFTPAPGWECVVARDSA